MVREQIGKNIEIDCNVYYHKYKGIIADCVSLHILEDTMRQDLGLSCGNIIRPISE